MAYQGEGGLPDIKNRIFRESGQAVLDSQGTATITFDNPAPTTIGAIVSPLQSPAGTPVIVNVTEWIGTTEYTGMVIQGYRLRSLPNPLTLLSALVGFECWTDTSADGLTVYWVTA